MKTPGLVITAKDLEQHRGVEPSPTPAAEETIYVSAEDVTITEAPPPLRQTGPYFDGDVTGMVDSLLGMCTAPGNDGPTEVRRSMLWAAMVSAAPPAPSWINKQEGSP